MKTIQASESNSVKLVTEMRICASGQVLRNDLLEACLS